MTSKNIQILLALILLGIPGILLSQNTAVDFTANDCSGTSHHLYSELDAGKVVVISFVMPCGSCIGPSQSALATVQGYATSHPGRVIFYLIDDVANTSCTTLSTWANTNGMGDVIKFSNSAVTETPYGSGGMPKVVVLGGTDHTVYFTENGGVNTTNLTNAINSALTATTGISEENKADFQLAVYPNPAIDKLLVNYTLNQPEEVRFDIYNILGLKIGTITNGKQSSGKHEAQLDCVSLPNGIYFLSLNAGEFSQMMKFTITR